MPGAPLDYAHFGERVQYRLKAVSERLAHSPPTGTYMFSLGNRERPLPSPAPF